MDYREKAVRCVRETVLPVQMAQFEECGRSLDAQYRKYGDTEGFFAKVLQPGHRHEVGYPKCVCPEVQRGDVTDAAHCAPGRACCTFWNSCCWKSALRSRRWRRSSAAGPAAGSSSLWSDTIQNVNRSPVPCTGLLCFYGSYSSS